MTRLIIGFLLSALAVSTLAGQGMLQTDGRNIIDDNGEVVLLRGLGLGGWLVPEGYMLDIPGYGSPTSIRNMITDLVGEEVRDEFYRAYEANYVTEDDIELIASWGFNHIRIPFHYQLFTSLEQPTEFKPEGFALMDTLLAWCQRNSLYLILDLHCAPGGQNPGNISDSPGTAELWSHPEYQDITVALWRRLAEHYVGEPWIGGYDLLNEPVLSGAYNNSHLRALYFRITQAIREVDPDHIIFIEGNWYATDFSMLTPPFTDNLVYAFHNYWSGISINTIQHHINMSQTHNVPLWCGEFGENSNHWAQETIRILEQEGIGWNWWTHKKLSTITSPLSAPTPWGFQAILNYWNEVGTQPLPAQARAGLLALAENLKLENCELHPDVLHAITTDSSASAPYARNILPGILPVQNYDMGLEGRAYHDTEYAKTHWDRDEPWNLGYVGRSDGVDLQEIDGRPGEFSLSWIEDGEWINYTVQVQRGGRYQIVLESSSPNDNGRLSFRLNGNRLITGIQIPPTNGYFNWTGFNAGEVNMPEGTHELRVFIDNGDFNLKSMELRLVADSVYTRLSDDIFMGEIYPNPFNATTTLPLVLNSPQEVTIDVYNLLGSKITTLHDGFLPNGASAITWSGLNDSGRQSANGVYFYHINLGGRTEKRKVTMIR